MSTIPGLGLFTQTKRQAMLPPRIRAAVEARERRNEILVRIIQLMIVLFFGMFYLLSPKLFPRDAIVTVPYVLEGYVILILVGLVWSILRKLPDWAVYCSILFDFIMLYGLMISFHFQYMQPASFILKSPTLLYVFIFIALRTLRFEAKFVLASGVIAALGWLLIVFYVVSSWPGDTMITHSYVEYLTSNSVLVGAEIDKIVAILAVTLVLSLSVHVSSGLFISSIDEALAASELSRFVADDVAENIRNHEDGHDLGQAKNVRASIIYIDLRGFTAFARDADPSRVMNVLTAYQGRILPIIKANDGTVDKFLGDGIMARFGVENEGEDCAISAMRAIEEILADWLLWGKEESELLGGLSIGLGAAIGTVAYGAVGKDDRLEMTVIGTPVNLAARLEKFNKSLHSQCVVSRRLWDAALAEGYEGKLIASFREEAVAGIGDAVNIAILTLPEVKIPEPGTSSDNGAQAAIPVSTE